MTTPETSSQTTEEPIIPIAVFVGIAIIALVVAALAVVFGAEQVISIGAIAVGLISIVAGALLNPQETMDFLRGRSVSYGGTAIIVTMLVIIAAGTLYALVSSANLQTDLSGSEEFTLNSGVRDIIETLAADQTTPDIQIVGFFTLAQAAQRDRIELLLQDFSEAGGDKISYEFIDPNRAPLALEEYGAAVGQLVVVRLDENGEPLAEDAEIVPNAGEQTQVLITDSIITLTASGDFRAYFLRLDDGISITDATGGGADVLAQQLRDRFRWTVEEISPLTIVSGMQAAGEGEIEVGGLGAIDEEIDLLDPAADGEVLIIPGGGTPLVEEVVDALRAYVEQGGNLIVFADQSLSPENPALAVAENFDTFLNDVYGVSFNADLIVDPRALNQLGRLLVQPNNFAAHPITEQFSDVGGAFLQFSVPRSINLGDSGATAIVSTEDVPYAKTGLNLAGELTLETLQQTPEDAVGPLPLVAAAEGPEGSRLVLVGGVDPLLNSGLQLLNSGIVNFILAQDALFWAVDYDNAAGALADIPPSTNLGDTPLNFSNLSAITTINAVSIFVLPFGLLGLGILVWWLRREQARI